MGTDPLAYSGDKSLSVSEIERALLNLEYVREAVVVAVPDDEDGPDECCGCLDTVARYSIAAYANVDICAGECVAAVLVEKDAQEKVNLGINFEVCVRTQLSPCMKERSAERSGQTRALPYCAKQCGTPICTHIDT